MALPTTPERRRRLSRPAKLAFASGSLEEAMVGAAGIATMLFYNQVLGVSPALCGTAKQWSEGAVIALVDTVLPDDRRGVPPTVGCISWPNG